jgi:hypothetical protein
MLVCQQKNVPEAKLTVTRFGEDLSRERDFSAAYVGDRDICVLLDSDALSPSRTSGNFLVSLERVQAHVRGCGPEEREKGCNTPEVLC